jgi:hypothetical protein
MGRTCYCCKQKDKECSYSVCECPEQQQDISINRKKFEISGINDIDYLGSYAGKFVVLSKHLGLLANWVGYDPILSFPYSRNLGAIGFGSATIKYGIKTTGLSNFNGSATYKKDASTCSFILDETSFGSPSFIDNNTQSILPIGDVVMETYIDVQIQGGKLYTYFSAGDPAYWCAGDCNPLSDPCCNGCFQSSLARCPICDIPRKVMCPHVADMPTEWSGKIGTRIIFKAFANIANYIRGDVTCIEGPSNQFGFMLQLKDSQLIAEGIYSDYGKNEIRTEAYDAPSSCSSYIARIPTPGGIGTTTFECAKNPCEYLSLKRFYNNCKTPFFGGDLAIPTSVYTKYVNVDPSGTCSAGPFAPCPPPINSTFQRSLQKIIIYKDHVNFAPVIPSYYNRLFIFPGFNYDTFRDFQDVIDIFNCNINGDSPIPITTGLPYRDCFRLSEDYENTLCSTWDGEKMTATYSLYMMGLFGVGGIYRDPRLDKTNYKNLIACQPDDLGFQLYAQDCEDATGVGLFACNRGTPGDLNNSCNNFFNVVKFFQESLCNPDKPYTDLTVGDNLRDFANVAVSVPRPFGYGATFWSRWVEDYEIKYDFEECRFPPIGGSVVPCECTPEHLYSKTKFFLPELDWTRFTSSDGKQIRKVSVDYNDIPDPVFYLPKPPKFQIKVTYD